MPRADNQGAAMNWKQIEAEWDADPEFRRAYEEEYHFDAVARSIARLRGEHGLTQERLAQLAGTSQSVIARAETGRHGVNVELLNRIARAVGTTWEPVFVTPAVPMESYVPAQPTIESISWIVHEEAFMDALVTSMGAVVEHFRIGNETITASFTHDLLPIRIIGTETPSRTHQDIALSKAGTRQPALALAS